MGKYWKEWILPCAFACILGIGTYCMSTTCGVDIGKATGLMEAVADISLSVSVALAGVTITLYSIILSLTSKDVWKENHIGESQAWLSFSEYIKSTVWIASTNMALAFFTKLAASVGLSNGIFHVASPVTAATLGLVIGCTIVNTKTIIAIFSRFRDKQ